MKNTALEHFQHVFIDNKSAKTIFLLHGTGGTEHDLLPLVKSLENKYNFVGLKGTILEQGMSRFFVRNEFGVFDQDSIVRETKKLKEFLEAWKTEHPSTIETTVFLGYSNGANMILATAFLHPEIITTAVLLHSMLPLELPPLKFANKSFLVTYGENDQMIPLTESKKVVSSLTELGADVTVVSHTGGHEVRTEEIAAIEKFLNV